jgi:membrane protein implicated in regulation of membrane protease activity
MDLNDAESWRWIWLGAVVLLAVAELVAPGSFFMISFSAGALVATVAAFAGGPIWLQWLLFVLGSAAALALLIPIGRRLNRTPNRSSAGAFRWDDHQGVVLQRIPGGDTHATGLVRVEREEWRAESEGPAAIEVDTPIRVVRVDGTRLVVKPIEDA